MLIRGIPTTGIVLLALSCSGCGTTTPSKEGQPRSMLVENSAKDTTYVTASIGDGSQPSAEELGKILWEAARAGDSNTIGRLLKQGADIHTSTPSGETALHAAVAAGSWESAEILLQQGASINAATRNGWTPLHHAARFGQSRIAQLLLQHGANPKALTIDTPAKSALQMALDQGDLRTARVLGY